jgi:hypothetical protein
MLVTSLKNKDFGTMLSLLPMKLKTSSKKIFAFSVLKFVMRVSEYERSFSWVSRRSAAVFASLALKRRIREHEISNYVPNSA